MLALFIVLGGIFVELWDVYNAERQKTGRTAIRGQALKDGEYHIVVHIWVVNSDGDFLIQKRAACVQFAPNVWAATGGSALVGEDSAAACIRELYEEVGIEADMCNAEVTFTLRRKDSFCDVWVLRQDANLDRCRMQPAEVSAVKWASAEQITDMVGKGQFFPYSYLGELFDRVSRG